MPTSVHLQDVSADGYYCYLSLLTFPGSGTTTSTAFVLHAVSRYDETDNMISRTLQTREVASGKADLNALLCVSCLLLCEALY